MRKVSLLLVISLGQMMFSCINNSGSKTKAITDQKANTINNIAAPIVYKSEDLIIRKISQHIYQHTTFLVTNDSGRISCNGMIVVNDEDAVIFDTPTNDQTSIELLEYLKNEMNLNINAVIATHFHADALGGLHIFHRYDIKSYASNKTIKLAKKTKTNVPQEGFDKELTLDVGTKKVHLNHLGEGYTPGNIVGYFPEEQVLYGGGLIKEEGAEKGYLVDANTQEWSKTVGEVKIKYPQLKTIIPGHGKLGGPELLDYTMNLFKIN